MDRILKGRLLESDILYSKDDSLFLVKIMRFPALSDKKEVIFSQVFVCKQDKITQKLRNEIWCLIKEVMIWLRNAYSKNIVLLVSSKNFHYGGQSVEVNFVQARSLFVLLFIICTIIL